MGCKVIALLCATATLAVPASALARARPVKTAPVAVAPAPPIQIAIDPAAADRDEIKARLRDWVAGMVTRDPAVIENILSSDFQATTMGGRLIDRSSDIAAATSPGEVEVKAVTTKEVDIRVYGDAAVVRALLAVLEQRDGKIASVPIRITQTWIRRNGEWRAVADQSTRVEHPELWTPPASPTSPPPSSADGGASADR